MKKVFSILAILPFCYALSAQSVENPFKKLGYDVLVATSSKGEFAEFHDQKDIVEIGSLLYNTKTKEILKILDEGESTIDISSAVAAMSIDPHCEKYYWISPYAYVANNPLKYIDPDGRDIWIYYNDDEGNEQHFVFNGSNHADAPKNQFIADVLVAYDYNVANKGGENLKLIAEGGEKMVAKLRESRGIEGSYSGYNRNTGEYTETVWDSRAAEKTKDGHTMSPATVLEHEFAHTVSSITNPAKHKENSTTSHPQYKRQEEFRVITGAEATTAIANGEYPAGYVRPSHESTTVRVNTPITNGQLRVKPIQFLFKNAGKYKY